MVFGRFLRHSAEQDSRKEAAAEEPKVSWLKDERGWEDCQECPSLADEDEAFVEPATAPSTQEPEEADSETDWDWDLLGALPSNETVGALVIDDYLLVGESVLRSAGEPQERASPEGPAAPPDGAPEDCEAAAFASAKEAPAEPHTADGAAGPAAEGAPTGLTAAQPQEEGPTKEDKSSYYCAACSNLIFKEDDILSSNYHAMSGPGYLTSAATNVSIALEMQTQLYTTGKYTVREVSCGGCAAMLGVTYAGAADVRNRYKVGKFLLGRDRLRLPPGVVHPMEEAAK